MLPRRFPITPASTVVGTFQERRLNNMNYTKPEVEALGNARELIESTNPKSAPTTDSAPKTNNPAYDLDE
jgi:hypothetical protein